MSETAIKKKKTVLRTFRLNADVDSILQEEADRKNLSVNTLVEQLFRRYVEWDAKMERYETVTLSKDGFRSIIRGTPDINLLEAAHDAGIHIREGINMLFNNVITVDTFLEWTKRIGKYTGCFDLINPEWDERSAKFTLQHQCENKWSIYLEEQLRIAFKDLAQDLDFFRSEPQIRATRSQVTVKISKKSDDRPAIS